VFCDLDIFIAMLWPPVEDNPIEGLASFNHDDCSRVFATSRGHVATLLTVPATLSTEHSQDML